MSIRLESPTSIFEIPTTNETLTCVSGMTNRFAWREEIDMTMRKSSPTDMKKAGFPAEAGTFFEEVSEAKMAELRKETAKLLADDEWELVGGMAFPYDKCA